MRVESAPLRLLGAASAAERALLIDAGRQLVACLGAATGGEVSIELSFAPPAGAPTPEADIVIASLLGDVASDEPVAEVGARWRAWLGGLVQGDPRPIVIGTLFRHVADPAGRRTTTERIRRLNDLAIALSRAHGVEVADIDRAFAMFGSDVVRSDYRCLGPHATLVAGHVIVSAVLATDLSRHLSGAVRDRACAAHGTLADLVIRHRQEKR